MEEHNSMEMLKNGLAAIREATKALKQELSQELTVFKDKLKKK